MEREDALPHIARRLLWDEQLAELRALATENFRALGERIGSLPVGRCTRCGAPSLVVSAEAEDDLCALDCRGRNDATIRRATR